MRCCRSDWPGLCLFCCYQPLSANRDDLGFFLFFIKFPILPPPPLPRKPKHPKTNSWHHRSTQLPTATFATTSTARRWVLLVGGGVLEETAWNSIILYSNISYKRDGVDGFGQIQPYFISHCYITLFDIFTQGEKRTLPSIQFLTIPILSYMYFYTGVRGGEVLITIIIIFYYYFLSFVLS